MLSPLSHFTNEETEAQRDEVTHSLTGRIRGVLGAPIMTSFSWLKNSPREFQRRSLVHSPMPGLGGWLRLGEIGLTQERGTVTLGPLRRSLEHLP